MNSTNSDKTFCAPLPSIISGSAPWVVNMYRPKTPILTAEKSTKIVKTTATHLPRLISASLRIAIKRAKT